MSIMLPNLNLMCKKSLLYLFAIYVFGLFSIDTLWNRPTFVRHSVYQGFIISDAEASEAATASCGDKAGEMLEAVQKRSRELDAREERLRIQEQEIKILKQEIDAKIAELTKARQGAEKVLQDIKLENKQDMEKMVKIYESMTPEEAALRIENLGEELAVKLFRRMKGKTSGKILAFVEPAKAGKLIKKLASVKMSE